LAIAIVSKEIAPQSRVTLIESDQRKCAFLRTVVRETSAPVTVLSRRIEDVPPMQGDVISARALADLDTLLGYFERHADTGCVGLFAKGVSWKKELTQAQRRWDFSYERYTSETEEKAVILRIQGATRV
jgi:16S rRNA (guanine527-N7)-methyltransferase